MRAFSWMIFAALWFSTGAVTAAQEINPDTLPMFGQPDGKRPDSMKQADEAFIKNAISRFGDRAAASDALVAQGWEAMRAGRAPTALQRFNEGWLLWPANPVVFWGFGAVLSAQGKLPEAIEQLETARELMGGDHGQQVPLLADIGTVRSVYATSLPHNRELERAQQFSAANQRFAESLEIDPQYAPSWREWALSLYDQERYAEAAIKAGRARELKAESFPADFLRKLNSKIAELK